MALLVEEKPGGFLDAMQTILDLAGLVPGVGEIADGANAAIYLARGDKLNAGLSAAAMIPFAGWFSTGGKFALKYSDEVIGGVQAVSKHLDEGAEVAQGAIKNADNIPTNQLDEVAQGAGGVNPPKAGSLSDLEARKWYLEQEAKISEMIDKTQPLEQQAQQASGLRNQFRTQAREAMSNSALAEQLNITDPNMTWGEVVERYSEQGFSEDALYEEIIKASTRSRTSVNEALGIFNK